MPEPLLPPRIALQNPELLGGHPFFVLPALGRILVMIDHDGDENYEPQVVPLEGGFPERVADDPFAAHRSHLVDVDLATGLAYFAGEAKDAPLIRAIRANLAHWAGRGARREPVRIDPRRLDQDHSRVIFSDQYLVGDVVLYERDADGARTVLYGTPIDEREEGGEYPPSGLSSGHVTVSGAGALVVSTLFDDAGSPGYLDLARPGEIEPVSVSGFEHEGGGELERVEHLEGSRYALVYNIDGASWAYDTMLDEPGRTLTVERVLVGAGELAGGVLHGLHYDEGSGRFAVGFCTSTNPTQLYVLDAQDGAAPGRRTRERALGLAPELLSAGEDASFESHDGLRVSARLYLPSPRARVRGAAAARLLRPRRPAEPGAVRTSRGSPCR